jgi:hypothetical protein
MTDTDVRVVKAGLTLTATLLGRAWRSRSSIG